MIIRARRARAIFITTPTPTSPRARTGNMIIGIPGLLAGSARRAMLSASSDTEVARASVGTAIGSCALTGATATEASGLITAGGAAAWGLVSDNVLVCGAGTSGVDAVFSSCALCWTVSSGVPLRTGVGFGLAAEILTWGDGAAATCGEGVPDGAGVECKSVAGPVVAGAATCCAGWPGARTYQHLR